MPGQSRQGRGAVPPDWRKKSFPLGQERGLLPPGQQRMRKGERLSDQRADIVPSSPRESGGLRRDRLEPPSQPRRIGVYLFEFAAEEARGGPDRRDLIALLDRRQIRLLDQRDKIGQCGS
jgi:hypothetical protein